MSEANIQHVVNLEAFVLITIANHNACCKLTVAVRLKMIHVLSLDSADSIHILLTK